MKAIILIILVTTSVQSQLYVGNGSYLYNFDQAVTVVGNIGVQNGGNLYLRGSGQLLQKTLGTSANYGNGGISVFQEGTSNQYKYNYWCSPVGGMGIATTGNDPFSISQLNRPTDLLNATPAVMSAMNDYDGVSNPLKIAKFWVYKYQSGTQYSQWVAAHDNPVIGAGQGFTMKGVSGTDVTTVLGVQNNTGSRQRYDFRGRPNDGKIPVTVGNGQFTLTGNPYPSAIDLGAFLLDAENTALDGTALFWEQSAAPNSHYLANYIGGYGVYVPISVNSTGVYIPATFATYNGDATVNNPNVGNGQSYERKYAPIGQGFIVTGKQNGTVYLKNSHRIFIAEGSASHSDFARNSAPKARVIQNSDNTELNTNDLDVPSQIRVNVALGNNFTRQLVLILTPNATNGIDFGMEALNPDPSLPIDASFFQAGNAYVAEAMPFDQSAHIPLQVKSNAGQDFVFSLSEILNFDPAQPIYIYDNADGSYHDLRNGSFTVGIAAGTDNTRFELRFDEEMLRITGIAEANRFRVVENNKAKTLTVSNPDLHTVHAIRFFDTTGKLVTEEKPNSSQPFYTMATSGLPTGIYLLDILTADKKTAAFKIAITN